MRQGHAELEQRAQKLEREIKGLRDGQDQEAQELKSELEKVHAKRALVEQETEKLKRAQAESKQAWGEPARRAPEPRKRPVAEQDRENVLQDLRLRAEKMARVLKENPDMEAEKAETLRRELEETRAKIGAIEQEPRGPKAKKEPAAVAPKREYRVLKDDVKIEKKASDGPARVIKGPASNPQLEAEVKELRVQMQELHEQMQQMQKLLEQSMDRAPRDRPAR